MERTIVQVAHDNADLRELIRRLDEDLAQRYSNPDEVFTVDFTDPKVIEMIFIVAYIDGVPAGCGGIRPHGREFVELKRFYVDPAYRRHGIAAGMLSELEDRATGAGFSLIRLEAGAPQPEALAFYRKHNYYAIERFGEYADCESSLCYEKRL
ncbi:GNAT family N-acetyltransferase [Paenibacillus glycanilyticus]|uniref:GNAT family N-acetyltransferase n=1 Tax=Paenibacillus glycanilyticus TaxID=126569 RepID=UPI0020400AA2|nr:GNAT family N-acetyltransferase [Paenibacillus glycanilyticus]MCM3629573.1 GNAT family N-acetyltransferase [Paenibacillus glycanilyticus]